MGKFENLKKCFRSDLLDFLAKNSVIFWEILGNSGKFWEILGNSGK
tara:strand:+ start:22 stop:159 length:138 start_codon:yes stop_codon:yes gene_type:complete